MKKYFRVNKTFGAKVCNDENIPMHDTMLVIALDDNTINAQISSGPMINSKLLNMIVARFISESNIGYKARANKYRFIKDVTHYKSSYTSLEEIDVNSKITRTTVLWESHTGKTKELKGNINDISDFLVASEYLVIKDNTYKLHENIEAEFDKYSKLDVSIKEIKSRDTDNEAGWQLPGSVPKNIVSIDTEKNAIVKK